MDLVRLILFDMKISHKSTHRAENITADSQNITSNCNTISFSNCGSDDCKIYFNDAFLNHPEEYYFLRSGTILRLGNLVESIVQDTYDIVFMNASGKTQRVCIIRETFQLFIA